MRARRRAAFPGAALAPALVLLFVSIALAGETSFLFNPGPRAVAGLVWVNDPAGCGAQGCSRREAYTGIASTWDAHLDGNPPNVCAAGWPAWDGSTWRASDGSCQSYLIDTTNGWLPTDKSRYPGWDVWVPSGGNGSPIELQFLNHALTATGACPSRPDASAECCLREVGLVYGNGFPDPALGNRYGVQMFKANSDGTPMRVGQFGAVHARFKAKLLGATGPSRCTAFATGAVSADLRVVYFDRSGSYTPEHLVRADVLAIHLYEIPGSFVAHPPEVWSCHDVPACPKAWWRTLSGALVGVPQLRTTGFTSYVWDVKALLATHVPPPAGYTVDDAVLWGFDVYTTVRGSDVDVAVREVDLVGLDGCG